MSRVLRRLGVPTRAVVTAGGRRGPAAGELLTAAGLSDAVAVPVAGARPGSTCTLVTAGARADEGQRAGRGAHARPRRTRLVRPRRSGGAADRTPAVARGLRFAAGRHRPGAGRRARRASRARPASRSRSTRAARRCGPRSTTSADLVKPNRDELAELAGHRSNDVGAFAAAREVRARTGGTVLLSLGGERRAAAHPGRRVARVRPRIVPVNPTGAGDALLAGYLAGDAGDAPPSGWRRRSPLATSACLSPSTRRSARAPRRPGHGPGRPARAASTPRRSLRRRSSDLRGVDTR